MIWAKDFLAFLGANRPSLPRALDWAEDQREAATRPEHVFAPAGVDEDEGAELYSYIFIFVIGEPRTFVKASPGNRLEARRRLKYYHNPVTAITKLGYTACLMQPAKLMDLRRLQSAIGMWDE